MVDSSRRVSDHINSLDTHTFTYQSTLRRRRCFTNRLITLPLYTKDMERQKPAPVLARPYEQEDCEVEVIHKMYDTVTFQRGLGDSGRRIEITERECENCGFDRTLRQTDVQPELQDGVEYYCLCPSCPYYVSDKFGYAQPRKAQEAHSFQK